MEAGAARGELADDDRYAALRRRIAEQRAAVDKALADADWTATFSSLDGAGDGEAPDRRRLTPGVSDSVGPVAR